MHRTSRIIVGVLPQGFVPVRSPIGVVFPSEPSNRESEPGWAETAGICGSVARMELLGLPHVPVRAPASSFAAIWSSIGILCPDGAAQRRIERGRA